MARSFLFALPLAVVWQGCTVEGSVGEERGVLFGVAAGDGTSGPATTLTALEGLVGRNFRLDRIYRRWENAAPGQRERDTLAAGRIPIVSFNGRRDPEPPVSWASVADGEHDAYLAEVAGAYRALEERLFVLYHAGPDGNEPEYGSAGEYRAAYRHVVGIFRDSGANNVTWIWAMRSPAFATRAPDFYPGDDVVDWIGANSYNYGTEADGGRWISLRGLISDFVHWAAPREKPLILPEFGCIEDERSPGRKAAWFDDALQTFVDHPRIRAAAYFHREDGELSVASSPDALQAFQRLAQDPYMR